MARKPKPVIYSVPSIDIDRSRELYSKLLGVDLVAAPVETFKAFNGTIEAGLDISVQERHNQHETPFMYFAVDNLAESLGEAEQLGCILVWGPEDLQIDPKRAAAAEKGHPGEKVPPHVGRGAVLVEPGGSQLGLMELSPETHGHFKLQ